jgi:hypothetical protein
MKKANVLFDVVVMVISGFFFYKTLSFPEGPGQGGIGPAFFPQIILGSLILFSAYDLIQALFKKEISRFFEGVTRHNAISFIVVVAMMMLMIFFLGKLPFILIASVMIFVQCLILKMKVLSSLLTSVILSVSVYLIFVKGFSVLL